MRYQFVDEIVGPRQHMFVCVEPPAGDPARGARA
jgi:hypothetical protein